MKKRGSALIVAILLIAGVGAVAFGVARLLFLETSKASLYENGLYAYYAAESGVEESFLRYKYYRNVELPKPPASGWSLARPHVLRTDLTSEGINYGTATSYNGIDPTVFANWVTDKSKQYYDLKLGYLGTDQKPWYGRDIGGVSTSLIPNGRLELSDYINTNGYSSGEYKPLKIEQDNAVKIDLSNVNFTSNDVYIDLSFLSVANDNTNKCRSMAELKLSSVSGSDTTEYKELTSFNAALCAPLVNLDQNKLLQAIGSPSYSGTTLTYRIKINNLYQNMGGTLPAGGQIFLMIKPIYKAAYAGMFVGSCNSLPTSCATRQTTVPGPFTYIKSVGHYGGITRTLTANIDRQSGTIYDLFDYVIYKEN